jgi:hypothetical protein
MIVVFNIQATDAARRYYMPRTWMSNDHLAMWVHFLQDRYAEGNLTIRKLRDKIRRARRAFREQRLRYGGTPEEIQGRPDSRDDVAFLARQIAAKR